jgi:hypothetical protein
VHPDSQWTGTTYGVSPSGLVTSAEPGSYAFRNRFNITGNNRFNFNTRTHVLSAVDDSEHIVLTAGLPGKNIKECVSLNLWGSPYLTFDDALSVPVANGDGFAYPYFHASLFRAISEMMTIRTCNHRM